MATLESRIDKLERQTAVEQRAYIFCVMRAGADDEEIRTLGNNGLRRADGETLADFKERVIAHIEPGREGCGPALLIAGYADDDSPD